MSLDITVLKARTKNMSKLEKISGFPEDIPGRIGFPDILPCQELGAVDIRQDRLITFPSVMEHRLQDFMLADRTRRGCLRMIRLLLVDPNYRVCSTHNVPPQQHAWWAPVMEEQQRAALPPELVWDIMARTGEWPMGETEAAEHRERITKELRVKDGVRYGSMRT